MTVGDGIWQKAEAYIDACIESMEHPPSDFQRMIAIAKVDEHTRNLVKALAEDEGH